MSIEEQEPSAVRHWVEGGVKDDAPTWMKVNRYVALRRLEQESRLDKFKARQAFHLRASAFKSRAKSFYLALKEFPPLVDT